MGLPSADDKLTWPQVKDQRNAKLQEELDEFRTASTELEAFSELVDILYVVLGTADVYRWPIVLGLEEVHRANMSKTPNGFRPLKEQGFLPARLDLVLNNHREREALGKADLPDLSLQGRKYRANLRQSLDNNAKQSHERGGVNIIPQRTDDGTEKPTDTA